MTEQTAPPPQAAPNIFLKSIVISGTDLSFTVGKGYQYTDKEGTQKASKIVGMGVVKAPPQPNAPPNFQVQVHVQLEDGYTDIFLVEDHLVIRNIEVSAIAIPAKTILVPKA